MKTKRVIPTLLLWWLVLPWLLSLTATAVRAQTNFVVNWWTIDGGGGTSTGGVYSVSGTAGQPDAGKMSGGGYTLAGGFWAATAVVQTPGAPLLRVFLADTNIAVVAWPAPSTGFVLQQNADLTSTNWANVTNTVNIVGGEKQVTVSPPVGNRFYRLKFQP